MIKCLIQRTGHWSLVIGRLVLFFVLCSLFFASSVQALTTSTGGGTTVSGDYPDPCASGSCGGGGGGGDSTAPAAVTDLNAAATSTSAIFLTWTAPGDDANSGTAASYYIRYSLSAINDFNWESATQIVNAPAPLPAGNTQSVSISGLTPNTTYYFALKAVDEGGNQAGLSNVVSARTLAQGEQADATPPSAVINLVSGQITTSTLILAWTAPGDDANSGTAAGYDIRYSTSAAITSGNWASATQATGEPIPLAAGSSQSFKVTDLTPDTTYYFALKTRDEANNWSGISNSPSAKTLAITLPDATPPIISNIQVSSLTATSSVISWSTDENATSTVVYGQTAAYEIGAVSDSQFVTAHQLTLANLISQTTYHFKVKSADASANEAASLDQTFTTLDVVPPTISNVAAVPAITSAVITWQTNESADSQAAYGLTSQLGGLVSDADPVTEHSLSITGLAPNKKYFYIVRSTDASGNQGSGDLANFTTLKDANSPANVSSFQAQPGDKTVSLSWQNPPDTDLAGVLIRRSAADYPKNPAEGDKIYQGLSQSFQDTGLTNGVLYYYTAFAFDTSGNYASGALASATPQAGLLAQCRDGLDNDGDEKIDFPADPGCSSLDDNDEIDAVSPQPQCNDGLDNDGDGKIDLTDPGCASLTDDDETDLAVMAQCGDGLDNDGDGKTDYPADPGCASSADNDETDEAVPPAVPVPSGGGTSAPAYRLELTDFHFSLAKGKIPLASDYKISSLVGTGFLIGLEEARTKKSVESIMVNVGAGSYLFSFDAERKQWQTEVTAPRQPGLAQVNIIANFYDQTNSVVSFDLEALPYGQIFEIKDGQEKAVEGAKVSLLTSPTLWPAGDFGQLNPQLTGPDGAYGFLAPPGKFILKVEKNGYRTEETGYFNSPGAVINQAIELLPLPPGLKEISAGNIAQVLGEQATFVSKVAAKEVKKAAKQTARAVKETAANPEVQKATKEVAAPAVATAAAAGTAGAVGLTPLLNYLRFLFTQPALLFRRRRRKSWGVVYNSLTKLPVDLVTVRLVEASTGRVVQTRVTDKAGRYAFFAPVGFYRLEISHHQFNFPSQFLGALKEDDIYLDLYHGETIEVKEKNTMVTANLPLDPLGAERPIGRLIWQLIWRRFQHSFSLISLVLALLILCWLPSLLTTGLFVFQIVFYFLFRRLAIPPKRKGWGVIADEEKKRPLKRAIARIFDRQYNKLLETQLSDAHGRYGFLVGRNEYYLTYEKDGYHKKQSESVDLRQHPESVASVGINVGLKPRLKEDVSQPFPPAQEIPVGLPPASEKIERKEINGDKEIRDKNYPQKNDFVI